MVEKLTLCLVGPKGAGKSSLVASLTECVIQSAHGYSPDLRPALKAVSRMEFDEPTTTSKFEILGPLVGEYERLRREFVDGGTPTPRANIYPYYFKLMLNGEAAADLRSKAPFLLEIVDASGDLVTPADSFDAEAPFGVREKYATKLLSAEAIVFVLPLVRFEDCTWIADIGRLIERLSLAADRRAKRFVIAFSHYERLFTLLGPSAFTYACDPAVALHVVRKALQAAPWLDPLRSLSGIANDAKVRFTVFSAYGFTKTFQNPNLDPHQTLDRRFHRASVDGPRSLKEYWRPFLTAEPLLYAALGVDSAFTFSYPQIDGLEMAFAPTAQ